MPDAFVARQPIFNPKLEVVGYELLFRGQGYANDAAMIANPESATATVVLNALTELDLARLVGNRTAWVNISREFVTGGLAHALPSGLVGLEIPETEQFDEDMLGALRDLKHEGYKLALDDFRYRPGSEALLELFDLVKLNINELGRDRLTDLVTRLKPYEGKLVAEKLSTQADHEFCVEAGCDLFQGYFFCRPAVACTRGIAANRLALLGIENIKRWATLSVLASIDDKPTELTVTALIRARFCELAGEPLGIASPSELFTLGRFSVLDAMMDAPMIDVIESLPLAAEMRDALVSRKGKRGLLLQCVTGLETGEVSDLPQFVEAAGELYLESMMWANSAADSLFAAAAPKARPKSTPPPVSHLAPAPVQPVDAVSVSAPADKRGAFARLFARLFGWLGRRPSHEPA